MAAADVKKIVKGQIGRIRAEMARRPGDNDSETEYCEVRDSINSLQKGEAKQPGQTAVEMVGSHLMGAHPWSSRPVCVWSRLLLIV